MLIKSADDKSKRLCLLEELRRASGLDRRQRDWLAAERKRVKDGIGGERDAAYCIATSTPISMTVRITSFCTTCVWSMTGRSPRSIT